MSVPNLVRPTHTTAYSGTTGYSKGDYQKCGPNNIHNIILAFAVFVNNTAYLIYNYLSWIVLKQLALKLVAKELIIMPVSNNLVLYCLISFLSTYLWGTFLTQGFEIDPFSNVISYMQKQIGKGISTQ